MVGHRTLGLVVLGTLAIAGAAAEDLSIRLYDQAHASPKVTNPAMDEANWLFRSGRIHLSWECPTTESAEDEGTEWRAALFPPDTRGYVVVRLITGAPANVLAGSLGYALPTAHTGAHVIIFYDRVETVAQAVNQPFYAVLGYVIAHELGHVLLRSSDHTSAGLMQGHWTRGTWHLAAGGLLGFQREQAQQMAIAARMIQK